MNTKTNTKPKAKAMPEKVADPFSVDAGRQILFEGYPFISIQRNGDLEPVKADRITHTIAYLLNRYHKQFDDDFGLGPKQNHD
jgi:hypothetical protein